MKQRPFNSFVSASPEGNFGTLHGSIGWGILFMNVYALLVTITVYFLYDLNATLYTISAFVLFCLPLVIVMKFREQTLGIGYGIVFCVFCWALLLIAYVEAAQYLDFFHKKEVVKDISIKEVDQYKEADAFYFRDGKILFDQHGDAYDEDTSTDGTGSSTTYVVPFVPDNWKETDSIHVWLVGEERNSYSYRVKLIYSDLYTELQNPCRSGMVLKGWMGEGNTLYAEAMQSAKDSYHLISSTKPIFLQWMPAPENYIKDKLFLYLNILFYFNIGWIAFVIIHRIVLVFKKKV